MSRAATPLSSKQIEARRKNAKKSTGPRTEAGKWRAKFNALKHGAYARPDWARAVGPDENPADFAVLLIELMKSHRPSNAAQRMLVEDLANVRWQRRRNRRAQEGVLACKLEKLELERLRRDLEIDYEECDASAEEVLEGGLRQAKDSPAKFKQLDMYLNMLLEQVERWDFSEDAEPVFRMIYGKHPTLRGASIIGFYESLAEAWRESRESGGTDQYGEAGVGPSDASAECGDGQNGGLSTQSGQVAAGATEEVSREGVQTELSYAELRIALLEELRDITQKYQLYLREQVLVSPAMRDACLAPSQEEWRLLIRQQNAIDRQIERKTRLLMALQKTEGQSQDAVRPRKARDEKKDSLLRNEAKKLLKTLGRGKERSGTKRRKGILRSQESCQFAAGRKHE